MNPFTQYLSQWSRDGDFAAFVEQWDRLERLVVGVYRGKLNVDRAAPEFEALWPWLRREYGAWAGALRPYWQATRAAGEPTQTDPFRLLLDIPAARAISGDWRAMQHLPAAREAINRYLVDHSLG
jgi:hypothetical protein